MNLICVESVQKLACLGLAHYYDLLNSNGFASWESVQRITEIDMERLQIKRGSRRKLLRAIATDQGYPFCQALKDPSIPKDSLCTNSASEDQCTVVCQYSSERNAIPPTPLRRKHLTPIKCSDPVYSEYHKLFVQY
jgi:hypothetical protein